MGAPRTTPRILEVLNDHRGLDVPVSAITKATGYTDAQVLTGINNLIKRDNLPITVVARSRVWRYEASNAPIPGQRQPEEPPQDRFFEMIGRAKSGDIIVKGDETETLYRLVPVEF